MDFKTKIKKFVLSWLMLGLVIGGVGGYLYYHYIGCASGSCPITSNPYISTLYGTLLGGLLFYRPRKKAKDDPAPQE